MSVLCSPTSVHDFVLLTVFLAASASRRCSQRREPSAAVEMTKVGGSCMQVPPVSCKGAITSKIKHAIKHKTSPAILAQLLQPSLAFCFSSQPMTACAVLDGTSSLAAS